AVDAASGRLTSVGWRSGGGKTPRFFTLGPAEDVLFVANEESDDIVALRIDPASGALTPIGSAAKTGSPVCIVFNAAA
ncbi:beta-propeller fold lactonase family protein, partial [bacterium]|nr:beta-propeller fold lactonase family protein [bacterium]